MFSPLCVPDEPDPQMTMFDLLAQQYRDEGAEEWLIWLAEHAEEIDAHCLCPQQYIATEVAEALARFG